MKDAIAAHPMLRLVQDAWLKHQLFLAYFWDVLHTGYSELNAGELEAMDKGNGWDRYTFTPAEHGTANVVTTLLEFYALYARPQQFEKSAAAEFIRQLFANLESWLTQSSEALTASTASGLYASMSLAPDLKIPVWYHYHELFSYLEQCKFILATLEYALNENKKQPCIDHQYLTSATKALKSECTNLSGNVWHSATTLRDKFRDQAFLQKLDEAALGGSEVGEDQAVIAKEIKNLGHQPEIKKVCWDLRDSWIDALEGVSRTKFA